MNVIDDSLPPVTDICDVGDCYYIVTFQPLELYTIKWHVHANVYTTMTLTETFD